MMQYKGYLGKVEFDDDAGIFHGEVANTRDVVTFQGKSVAELKKAFRDSVEDYLAFCAERDEEPNKPFSGQFVARIPPELHRKVHLAANVSGKSLNAWVSDQLQSAVACADLSQRSLSDQNQKTNNSDMQFWAMIAEEFNALEPQLSAPANLPQPHVHFFQIRITGRPLKPIHYEWVIQKQKSQVSVGLHFESDYEQNMVWLKQIDRIRTKIQDGVIEYFDTKPGNRKWPWANFAVGYDHQPDSRTAQRCAVLMKKLIDDTLPTVLTMLD